MGLVIDLFKKAAHADAAEADGGAKAVEEMSARVMGEEPAVAQDGYAAVVALPIREEAQPVDLTLVKLLDDFEGQVLRPNRLPPNPPELYRVLYQLRAIGGLNFGREEQQELFLQIGSLSKAVKDLGFICTDMLSQIVLAAPEMDRVQDHLRDLIAEMDALDVNDLAKVEENREALYLINLKVARMDHFFNAPEGITDDVSVEDELASHLKGFQDYIRMALVSLARAPMRRMAFSSMVRQIAEKFQTEKTLGLDGTYDAEVERRETAFRAQIMELDLSLREILFWEGREANFDATSIESLALADRLCAESGIDSCTSGEESLLDVDPFLLSPCFMSGANFSTAISATAMTTIL